MEFFTDPPVWALLATVLTLMGGLVLHVTHLNMHLLNGINRTDEAIASRGLD